MWFIYKNEDNQRVSIKLGEEGITIGRHKDAMVQVNDHKISRLHFAIRSWDGDYYLKDLDSKNGTWVNGEQVGDMVKLHPRDIITAGSTKFYLHEKAVRGTDTILHEVEREMEEGKGYRTILREIVDDSGPHE